MRNQKGFTLIELIIVIVVLGILAVTAAPQFIDFSSDARTSTVKGVRGSIKAAQQTVYAKAQVAGETGATGTVDGIGTVYGYPDATNPTADTSDSRPEIAEAASLETNDWVIWESDVSTDGKVYIGPVGVITANPTSSSDFVDVDSDTSGDQGCFVSYTNPASSSGRPSIDIDTSGC